MAPEAATPWWRAALLLATCAALAIGLLQLTDALTHDRIEQAQREEQLRALRVVLQADRFDNDPQQDRLRVRAPHWLGSEEALDLRRARLHGRDSALVLEVVANDGYAGPIHALLAIAADGTVLGVRITQHHETPGLGDPIAAERSDWIHGFRGRRLGDPPLPGWRVRKDGGEFDQFAGATVSPRAVVGAVRRALQFVDRHGAELYAAPAGGTLEFADAP